MRLAGFKLGRLLEAGDFCEEAMPSQLRRRCVSTQSSTENNPVAVEYGWQEGEPITKSIGGAEALALTGSEVVIDELRFYVIGTTKATSGDYIQPRIIIIVRGSYDGHGQLTTFNLQTMVSQRRIDI